MEDYVLLAIPFRVRVICNGPLRALRAALCNPDIFSANCDLNILHSPLAL